MSARDLFPKIDGIVARYRVVLQVRHLLVGGIPSDRSVIEGFIRAKMDLGDAAIAELVDQTVAERGVITPDEAVALVMASDLSPSVNGFKRDPVTGELLAEGRTLKAALKEFSNSAYPGTDYPGKPPAKKSLPKGTAPTPGNRAAPQKGLKSTLEERVFVEETFVGLGVKASDIEPEYRDGALAWVEERIKHVMTPQGPRSAINKVEVVYRPRLEFTLRVHDDFLPQEAWGRIWERGEDIGIGADRGRSDGMFTLETWERIK